MTRVVVVGAGIAGLTTAARLADFGHEVTILERGADAGGQAGPSTVDGLVVDTGPTTFTLPAVFRDLFSKTGRPLERELDLLPVDPSVRYAFPDGTHVDLPNASQAGTAEALDDALGAGAGSQWNKLIHDGERMWQLLRPRLLEHSPSGPDLAWLAWHPQARRTLHGGATLRDLAEHRLHDPRLRLMLDSYATSIGALPERAPAALATLAYVDQTFGTWTVRGGVRRLVDALQQRAADRGAKFRFSTRAARVTSNSGRVTGVRLDDGELLPADVVVSTAPAGQLELEGLPSGRSNERTHAWTSAWTSARTKSLTSGRQAATATDGRSVFTVLLSLRVCPPLPARSVLLTEDGPNVTLAHSDEQLEASAGEPHALALHADCPPHGFGPGHTDWTSPGAPDTHAQQLLGLAAARGVDLRPQIINSRIRTPYHLEQALGAPGGRVYGAPWHGKNPVRRRLGNRSSVHGLLFAGAAAHPGPGLPLVAISAMIVADLVGRA